mmetsp:Transcript_34368/g.72348  ORF Transcript_34368/g.72348 Transcript_34368/m.72348 type:complete len:94 (+) Transcript_34368:23-304(+)
MGWMMARSALDTEEPNSENRDLPPPPEGERREKEGGDEMKAALEEAGCHWFRLDCLLFFDFCFGGRYCHQLELSLALDLDAFGAFLVVDFALD